MQYALTQPAVLRAIVSLKQWTKEENYLCSAIMEEQVCNLQMLAVVTVIIGFMFLFATGVSFAFAVIGIGLMGIGAQGLREEDKV